MVTKADFTPEEWYQVLIAPRMASIVASIASPSSRWTSTQEMLQSSRVIMEAMQGATGNALIDAVAADFRERREKREKLELPAMSEDLAWLKEQCLQALRDVAALVDLKAPAEAEGFKQWVYRAGRRSAEVSREGGVLGIGGQRVNEAEAAALQEVAVALGITPAPAAV